jgi:hypothetical protein
LAVALLAAVLVATSVGAAAAAVGRTSAVDAGDPPTPDLRRPVLLSLARRVAPPGGAPLPVGGEAVTPYRTGPTAESPEILPPPPLASGDGDLFAVGDSVLLGAEPYLRTTLDGWDVTLDARVSRGVPEGFDIVRENRDQIGDVLVVVLGHNYGGGGRFGPWLEDLLVGLGGVQRVVLVTVTEWSPAQAEVNRAIRVAPGRHQNVVVADWAAVVAANPQFLRDHVHPSRTGAMALANLIGVMTGPVPGSAGRPRLLPIPFEWPTRVPTTSTTKVGPGGTGTSFTWPSTSTTRTTRTTLPTTTATTAGSTTTTSRATSTTPTTVEPSTTTTVAGSTTSSSTPTSVDGGGGIVGTP